MPRPVHPYQHSLPHKFGICIQAPEVDATYNQGLRLGASFSDPHQRLIVQVKVYIL
jgi:hypothetical protein